MPRMLPDGATGRSADDADPAVPQCLSVDDWLQRAPDNGFNGWTGRIPIGREDRGRYKLPWTKGLHGIHGSDATPGPLGGRCRPTQTSDAKACRASSRWRNACRRACWVSTWTPTTARTASRRLRGWDGQFGPLPPHISGDRAPRRCVRHSPVPSARGLLPKGDNEQRRRVPSTTITATWSHHRAGTTPAIRTG